MPIIRLAARAPRLRAPVTSTLGIAMHPEHGQLRFGSSAGGIARSSGLMLAVRVRLPVQSFRFGSASAAHFLASKYGFCAVSMMSISAMALPVGVLRRTVNRAVPFAGCSAATPARGRQTSAHGVHSSSVARPAGSVVLRVQGCGRATAMSSAKPQSSCPTQNALPNWSVNRTRYGKSPWPRGVACLSSTSRPGRLAFARRLAQR